ncbi:MAG: RNA-binding transcriptional accessory protein [Bacteroidales bacterium]|nr:RNA-binding transcriptional accessory protein [Bacteroidales bacterium]
MEEIISVIARELGIPERSVKNTVDLLDGGATVPFISRYRKEATGALDEVKVENILDRLLELRELARRKEYVIGVIESKEQLTPELRDRIEQSWNAAEIEDLYLPFKTKRKTRAEAARQKGLEPLAKLILSQKRSDPEASRFVGEKVATEREALDGAKDIIAAWVNEDSSVRGAVRVGFERTATIRCHVIKGKEQEGRKYANYFDVSEPLRRCPSHRLLGMRRGEDEGILRVSITPGEGTLRHLLNRFVKDAGLCSQLVKEAVEDSYSRLLCPSIENEFAAISKRAADIQAIEVFATNLRGLLLGAPLGSRQLMAIDPGIRTGCKVVILDAQGNLLHHDTIYPHSSRDKMVYAEMQLLKMLDRYDIKVIAIGSGTAGRETREFIEALEPGEDVEIYMVNEDGASVYSASEVARREFPDHDVTVRGAISIGRRLMDPLAELVKIDPKAIGVGQYQHDVDQGLLKKKLESVTVSCVNHVGVNLNTASTELLTFVSGIGPALARAIVDYRKTNGAFASRKQLLKVPRLGAKVFEQCAGFLRIPDAKNPLDNTAVHPERYELVQRMAADMNADLATLIKDKSLRDRIQPENYTDADTGLDTLIDILGELEKPGRDPREKLHKFEFDSSISGINDLRAGMILPGIVANVTDFGCFVDLGIKTKGLVHVSKLAKQRVRDPRTVVSIRKEVNVEVIDVDIDRGRISLSMIDVPQP